MKRLLLALPLLLLAVPAWRAWQGPLVPGYVLDYQPLQQRVVASGLVSSQSRIQIGSEIIATVSRRLVREGDVVRAGDLLIELHSDEQIARVREAEAALRQLRELERPQAEAALREAQSQHAQARRERERRQALQARDLLPLEAFEQAQRAETAAREAEQRAALQVAALAPGASQEQLLTERLATARAALARTRLLAPVDGTVQSRHVEPGDLVQPGRLLLELTRADSREIRVALDEKHLAPLAIGQPAYVIADAYPQQALAARVSFIAPAIDSARGTVDVHLEVEQEAPFLRQGMTVSVDIRTARREQALVIPHDALYSRHGAQARARVLGRDGRVEERHLRLGLEGSTLSEVLEGLEAGDQVLAGTAEAGQRVRLQPQPLPDHGAPSGAR